MKGGACMSLETLIKLAYQIFIKLPYICAFGFLIASIYHFKNENDELYDSLHNFGFSLLAIISCLICFNILLPNIFNHNDNGIIQFIASIARYLIEIILISIISIGILDNERFNSERFKIICCPPVFLLFFSFIFKFLSV